MHEMAIAQGVLDIVLDTAARHDAKKIMVIKLQVGQMTGVEPDALRFCLETLAEGTISAGAQLEIVVTPLIGQCRDCGLEFGIERYRFLCPDCGSAGVDIISGRELRVEHLEVD
jgi:hydrogenase nickel incorporation protein HypA/HybF